MTREGPDAHQEADLGGNEPSGYTSFSVVGTCCPRGLSFFVLYLLEKIIHTWLPCRQNTSTSGGGKPRRSPLVSCKNVYIKCENIYLASHFLYYPVNIRSNNIFLTYFNHHGKVWFIIGDEEFRDVSNCKILLWGLNQNLYNEGKWMMIQMT